jgi:hypothetical protein
LGLRGEEANAIVEMVREGVLTCADDDASDGGESTRRVVVGGIVVVVVVTGWRES